MREILDRQYAVFGYHEGGVLCGNNGEEISAAAINFHDNAFEKIEVLLICSESARTM